MSQGNKGGRFADYHGELELDIPDGKRPGELGRDQQAVPPSASTWSPSSEEEQGPGGVPRRRRPPTGTRYAAASKGGGFPVRLVVFVCLLGVGGYGGYFGYSKYKAGKMRYAFSLEAGDLRQSLLRLNKTVNAKDVKGVVLAMAQKVGVDVDPTQLKITIEPLDGTNKRKLTTIAQTALNIAGKMKNYTTPPWLVGFSGRFRAKYGVAKVIFEHQRYTYTRYADPGTPP